jgi:hypothetical protein
VKLFDPNPNEWPIGAGIVGIAGAISAAISGRNSRTIIVTVIGMLAGLVLWVIMDSDPAYRVARAALLEVSKGT